MASNGGHRDYDENLLASAPAATKAQLQSGYNPDLLVEKPTSPRSRRDVEARGSSPVEKADHEPMPPKVPFYRTRKGLIIIAVVAIAVIIAAAVGGAVGGKKKTHAAVTQQGPAAQTSTEGGAVASTTPANSQGGGVPDSTHATSTGAGQTTIGTGNPLSSIQFTPPFTRPTTTNEEAAGQTPS
ncbi:hypothetical protein M413DRAFT_256240 [Hebeloma cylindrosporum]|uniref:Uncharacterized protein n=1 Tax=Hebeloma cylindrosporum TaxID=76867 RepID=A0A0C3C0J3_HEBCY|nr:hypothetical protein M413DRAFT_256240 [Hebeloma cylindrosporum h7]